MRADLEGQKILTANLNEFVNNFRCKKNEALTWHLNQWECEQRIVVGAGEVRSPLGPHACGRAAVESRTQQKRVPGQQKWKRMLLSGNRSINPVLPDTGPVPLFDAASLTNQIRGEHERLVRRRTRFPYGQSHVSVCSSSGSESF